MVRTGEVVEKSGDLLTVVFERPAACENCNGCLSKQCTNIAIQGQAEVGDQVDVALPDQSVVKASAIAYIVPLCGLVAGLLLGGWLHSALGIQWSADLFAAAVGGVCLIVGILIVYGIDRRLQGKRDWQPRLVAVHPKQ